MLILASVHQADERSRPTQDTVPHELPRLLLIFLPLVSSGNTVILRRVGLYRTLPHASVEPRWAKIGKTSTDLGLMETLRIKNLRTTTTHCGHDAWGLSLWLAHEDQERWLGLQNLSSLQQRCAVHPRSSEALKLKRMAMCLALS